MSRLIGSEIIPFEPESDNADEGNKLYGSSYFPSSFSKINFYFMIYINDACYPFDTPENLSAMFKALNIDAARGIAVAVNSIIIPKKEWSSCLINDNDKIILIKATQGG